MLDRLAAGARVAMADDDRCCDMHGRNCEPPAELCCQRCTEAAHPAHGDGAACSSPDLSGGCAHRSKVRLLGLDPRYWECFGAQGCGAIFEAALGDEGAGWVRTDDDIAALRDRLAAGTEDERG